MPRIKKSESVPVRIRFKELKGGNKSLYLDICHDGRRRYEFLKLFLVPETTVEARERNENTMKAANAIKAQRILDITNKKTTAIHNEKARMPLLEWLDEYGKMGEAKGRRSLVSHIHAVRKFMQAYNPRIRLYEVDKDFIQGFIDYLGTCKSRMRKQPLSKKTISSYCGYINYALNYAVDIDVLPENPLLSFDWASIDGEATKREYLTIEEVQKLIDAPCKSKTVKPIFLFSCFCGLRYSDVKGLRWKDIIEEKGKVHIELRQQKTGKAIYLPLSQQAQKYLPQEKGDPNAKVFVVMPTVSNFDHVLKTWSKAAGITKRVSYHVSRHAFATMTLTMGADIYTTSQLLGHSDVEVTQVYAKIVDKKKIEAVYMVDKLFEEEEKELWEDQESK